MSVPATYLLTFHCLFTSQGGRGTHSPASSRSKNTTCRRSLPGISTHEFVAMATVTFVSGSVDLLYRYVTPSRSGKRSAFGPASFFATGRTSFHDLPCQSRATKALHAAGP